jgi:nucleoid DNA-binding protein|tara:strand:+ start:202 stop:489 length:288 start_codon:yes stop_codon:yes gene_type:complete
LSRPELIKRLKQKNPKISQSYLEIIIETVSESIQKSLYEGKSVQIRGFGTFFIKKLKKNFSARNPKTGNLIYIPERKKIRFKSSKKLKLIINEEI